MEKALDPGGFRSAVEANLALMDLVNPVQMSERSKPGANEEQPCGSARGADVHPATAREERRALSAPRDEPAERPRPSASAAVPAVAVGGRRACGHRCRAGSDHRRARVPLVADDPRILADRCGIGGHRWPGTCSRRPSRETGAVIASSQPAAVAATSGTIVDGLLPAAEYRIDSPIVLQIVEGTRTLGMSGGPIFLPAGSHDLTFVNNSLGVRTTQT